MKYGNFTSEGKVFRINTPDTPTEWTNYLFNDNYLAEVSQTLKEPSISRRLNKNIAKSMILTSKK